MVYLWRRGYRAAARCIAPLRSEGRSWFERMGGAVDILVWRPLGCIRRAGKDRNKSRSGAKSEWLIEVRNAGIRRSGWQSGCDVCGRYDSIDTQTIAFLAIQTSRPILVALEISKTQGEQFGTLICLVLQVLQPVWECLVLIWVRLYSEDRVYYAKWISNLVRRRFTLTSSIVK